MNVYQQLHVHHKENDAWWMCANSCMFTTRKMTLDECVQSTACAPQGNHEIHTWWIHMTTTKTWKNTSPTYTYSLPHGDNRINSTFWWIHVTRIKHVHTIDSLIHHFRGDIQDKLHIFAFLKDKDAVNKDCLDAYLKDCCERLSVKWGQICVFFH